MNLALWHVLPPVLYIISASMVASYAFFRSEDKSGDGLFGAILTGAGWPLVLLYTAMCVVPFRLVSKWLERIEYAREAKAQALAEAKEALAALEEAYSTGGSEEAKVTLAEARVVKG